ncbi:MAG: AMP-binding protein [Opitutaceae bacterium]
MLHQLLRQPLAAAPDRPLLESDGHWLTAAELEQRTGRLVSGLLAAGLEEGDRLALLLPNGPEAVLCYLAGFRLGLVVVPLDAQYHPVQIGHALAHCGAAMLIADHRRLPGLAEAGALRGVPRVVAVGDGAPGDHRPFTTLLGANRDPGSAAPAADSPAVMIYTSGTTSRPKGVVLSHGALGVGIRKYLARVTLTPDDVTLISAPIARPLALRCQLLPTLLVGGRVSLLRQFTVPDFVAALRRAPAKTFLTLTPGGMGQLVGDPAFATGDFSGLRLCLAGGDQVPVRLQEAFARLTGVAVTEQCGSTETGPYAMNPPFGRKKAGAIGLPAPGMQVAVVDEQGVDVPAGTTGELWVSGPGIMDGYWNDSAMTRKTLRDGWIRTGDLGRYDEDGYLWFAGRRKDLIVRLAGAAANKIAPREVEAALAAHPAVRECCVIGVPAPAGGEVPHAYVVAEPGSGVEPEALRAFVGSQLAEFMVPAEVHLIAALPHKGPGKVDRDLLRMRAITAGLVERVPFFREAGDGLLRDLIPRLEARTLAAGTGLVHEGDTGDEMYFLTKGQVEVLQGDPPRRLQVLREGAYFGELAVLAEAPRAATVRALTEVEVYALGRTAVRQLAEAHADFDRYLRAAAAAYGAAGRATS